jgi:uncharacterized protein (UPF0212 family)
VCYIGVDDDDSLVFIVKVFNCALSEDIKRVSKYVIGWQLDDVDLEI